MPGRTLPDTTAESVQEQVLTVVPRILDQAQISVANHQKNLVALYKLQTEAAQYTESVRRGRGNGVKLVGERIFEQAVLQMLTRVLPVKKGATQADRVIKFVGGYIKFVNEKGGCFYDDICVWDLMYISSGGREKYRGR
jgi:condensin complex subunit 3